jgi:hypothetical protein
VIAQLYALAFDDAPLDDPAVRKAHAEVVRGTTLALQDIENRPEHRRAGRQLLPRLMRELDDDEKLPARPGSAGRTRSNTGGQRAAHGQFASVPQQQRAHRKHRTRGGHGRHNRPALHGGRGTAATGADRRQGAFARFPDIVWDHSLHSAMAAASYAVLVADTDPFAAELLGMPMGLGSIIIVRVVRDEYALRPQLLPSASVATAVLDSWTSPTARHIAKSWELSDRMALALHEQLLDKSGTALEPVGRSPAVRPHCRCRSSCRARRIAWIRMKAAHCWGIRLTSSWRASGANWCVTVAEATGTQAAGWWICASAS